MKNKFGLSRRVPEKIKRQLRQEAGFGCVICGNAIGVYEHIDPEFQNATTHDPACMACLCAGCHGKVTRGHISKETVRAAKANPKSKEKGFSFEAFDIGLEHPIISLGPITAVNCDTILQINKRAVIWINPPTGSKKPFMFNGHLEKLHVT